MNNAQDFYIQNGHLLRCSMCGSAGRIISGSFLCDNGHCFDISSSGYINFMPRRGLSKYSRDVFKSRRAVFENGFYEPVAQKLSAIISKAAARGSVNVLDAGCGEGYYATRVKDLAEPECGINVLAMDIEKEAVQLASRGRHGIGWLVADIARIPVLDKQIGIVLNILSPASYAEFSRVLGDDGIIVKVIPGNDYLREIRALLGDKIKARGYSNSRAVSHFKENMDMIFMDEISYTLPVNREQAECFFGMTPMALGIPSGSVDIGIIEKITINLVLLAGRKPAR